MLEDRPIRYRSTSGEFFVLSRGQNAGQNSFTHSPIMAECLEIFDTLIAPRVGFELPVPPSKRTRWLRQLLGHSLDRRHVGSLGLAIVIRPDLADSSRSEYQH
jgi:hypothetical protein